MRKLLIILFLPLIAYAQSWEIDDSGDLLNNSDTQKLFVGAGDDASLYYDGTNFIITSNEVGTGNTQFVSDVVMLQTLTPTALIVPNGTTPTPAKEGSLFLDTDAGANGTLVIYSNGDWRTVQAF